MEKTNKILKNQLEGFEGQIYFELAIPRMGKRVDNIVIINDIVFVIEFKVGDGGYEKYAIEQAIDYTIDLKNFHEGSHHLKLIPVLVATNAENYKEPILNVIHHNSVAKSNQYNIADTLKTFINYNSKPINIEYWGNSIYKPTPTIVDCGSCSSIIQRA